MIKVQGYVSMLGYSFSRFPNTLDPAFIDFGPLDQSRQVIYENDKDQIIGVVLDRTVDSRGILITAEIEGFEDIWTYCKPHFSINGTHRTGCEAISFSLRPCADSHVRPIVEEEDPLLPPLATVVQLGQLKAQQEALQHG